MEIQGAEAVITKTRDGLRKDRRLKGYRHPELDARLRKSRTRSEARLLEKARKAGIPVPEVLSVNETELVLSEISGKEVKHVLNENPMIAAEIGKIVSKLHDANLIHADLTTSNMIYDEHVTLIDFGLSYHSARIEDRAVDIHLFKQSLESKHHKVKEQAYKAFLKGYRNSKESTAVLARLKKVEQRGKNKK